ncbi:MAG: hypothetical protein WBA77_16030 [Microcoleaceae cyanobacterium]
MNLFKKKTGWGKTLIINLFLLLAFLELGSLIFYGSKTKQFFYTRHRNDSSETQNFNLELGGLRLEESIVERLHPFFGYVQKPGEIPHLKKFDIKYNDYGFISAYEYPFIKQNENQYIVGVFGGSVASRYSVHEIKNGILEQSLKQIPELKNKEVIILSFATGGYKQPQQLLVLNYMLSIGQTFDLAINIDGFNEVALSNLNNQTQLAWMMPSGNHISSLASLSNNNLSTETLDNLLTIKQIKPQLREAINEQNKCDLAVCYTLYSIYSRFLLKNYQKAVAVFEAQQKEQISSLFSEQSPFYFYPQETVLSNPELYTSVAENWENTSFLMSQILARRNIPYFHFIQPNQYYPTKRQFSEAEKRIAFSDTSPYAEAVEEGYPYLLKQIDNLQSRGVNIFNSVAVLDNASEDVYLDNCCHYNEAGETIFSNYIAENIVNTLKNSSNN